MTVYYARSWLLYVVATVENADGDASVADERLDIATPTPTEDLYTDSLQIIGSQFDFIA